MTRSPIIRGVITCLFAVALAGVAQAQSVPAITSVANLADNSGAPFAPGSLILITGTNLASTSAGASSPLPTSLSGVSVTVGGVSARILSVSPTAVAAQISYGTATGNPLLQLLNGSLASNAFAVIIVTASPGIFPIIINPNNTANGILNPVAAGAQIAVNFTGGGALSPAVADGSPAAASPFSSLVATSSVTINGAAATVSSIGGAPNLVAGYDVANVTVPAGLAPGTYPIVVTVNSRPSAVANLYVGNPPQYRIETVAGQLQPNNVAATSTFLQSPQGLARDGAGNLYIAEPNGGVLRKVNFTTGIVTPVAGAGRTGLINGFGGLATAASFGTPRFVALDPGGNIFVADQANCTVDRIDATTKILTVYAGTSGSCGFSGDGAAATSAQLSSSIRGLAVDATGNVYIADESNARVRRVDVNTHFISTYAGNGSTDFSGDSGLATAAGIGSVLNIAFDNSGNLYLTGANRIRKVDHTTLNISTYAGTGNATPYNDGVAATSTNLSSLGGMAFDSSNNLFFNDPINLRVRRLDFGLQTITTIAGNGTAGYSGDGGLATSATIENANGLALDANGNVYVADFTSNVVRRLTPSGSVYNISTFAGSLGPDNTSPTSAFLNIPVDVTTDPNGNLTIAEYLDSRVRQANTALTNIKTLAGQGIPGSSGDTGQATAALLNAPSGVATDASGNIYIADTFNNEVRKITVSTGVITTVAGNAVGGAGFGGDGGSATAATALLNNPSGVAFDNVTGNLYIADTGNNRIRVVSGGNINTFAGTGAAGFSANGTLAGSAQLNFPVAVHVDNSKNVYITDAGNNAIREITFSDGAIHTIVGTGMPGYSGDGNFATLATLNNPSAIAMAPNGDIFISDSGNQVIRHISNLTGVITTAAGNGTPGYSGDGGVATAAQLSSPAGITTDSSGRILFAESANNVVRRLTQQFPLTTSVNPAGAGTITAGGIYDTGTVVNVTATPNANFVFTGFSGDAMGSTSPISVVMTYPHNIVANFAPAPPTITGIVNGGDFSSPPLAPGSLASVFGTLLASSAAGASGTPLPTTLNGVSATINGVAAHLTFVSAGQINLQIPYGTAAGSANVIVTNSGQVSNTFSFTVAATAPAIYPPAILNQNGALNSSNNPTLAGSTVSVYLTGIGAVSPAVADGAAGPSSPLSTPVAASSVTINGSSVTVGFIGLAPGLVGVAQANVVVPSSLANGSYPLVVTVGGHSSGSATIYVGVPQVSITNASNLGTFPVGTIQQPLYATGGLGFFAWSLTSGSLPPGIALRSDVPSNFSSNTSALLAGVATTPGTYNFTLTATSGAQTSNLAMTMKIVALNLKDVNVPDAFVGAAYSYAFTAIGNAGSPTFTIPATAGDGLTMSAAGVLSGNPSAAGFFSLPVFVNDGTNTILRVLTQTVYTVNITNNAQLPNGTQGAAYSTNLAASGGSGGYSFFVTGGSLPTGLSLNSGSGAITGTISANTGPGQYFVQIRVSDSSSNSYTKSMAIDVVGTTPQLTRINAGNVDDPVLGDPYTTSFNVCCGGAAPYTWTASGLPPGLSIRFGAAASSYLAPGTGEVWGVPTAAGNYTALLTATDNIGGSVRISVPMHVAALDHTPNFPGGTINTPITSSLRVLGGTAPYSVATVAGSVPLAAGLTLTNGQQNCIAFPGGLVPFTSVYYVSGANAAGDQLLVGNAPVSFLNNLSSIPLPSAADQQFCGTVTLATGYQAVVYVPTTAERTGDYGGDGFAGLLLDPLNGQAFPGGVIPMSRLPNPFAFRITSAAGKITGTPIEDPGPTQTIFQYGDAAANVLKRTDYYSINGGTSGTSVSIGDYYDLGLVPVSANYTRQLNASGAASITWSVTGGALPAGLTLTSGGLLSGAAATPGHYTFLIEAADTSAVAHPAFKQYILNVTPMTITTAQPSYLNVGTPFTLNLAATGGTGALTWTLTPLNYLPPGLTLATSGTLSGTPTAAGQYGFTVTVTDSSGNTDIGFYTFNIYPAGSVPPVTITSPASLGTISEGTNQLGLSASGGNGTYTWTLVSGALPPGMALRSDVPYFFSSNQQAGIIGVATTGGTYNFTLMCTSGGQSATQAFTLYVTTLTTVDPNPPDMFVGVPASYTFTAFGNAGSVTYSPISPLPPGLSLSSAGVLSGTPTTAGFFGFTFSMFDGTNFVLEQYGANINTVQVTTPGLLPNGTQGSPYSQPLAASGGTGSYTWMGGGLPGGLTLSSAGTISGTISNNSGPGTYYVTATATDGNGVSYSKQMSLDVVGVPPALERFNFSEVDDAVIGERYSLEISPCCGGTAPFTWMASGLPTGLAVRSGSGTTSSYVSPGSVEIYGVAEQAGTFNVTLTMNDGTGAASSVTFPLHVSNINLNAAATSSPSMAPGTLGSPYSFTFRVLGGTPPYTVSTQPVWGKLPGGLTVNGNTLLVSGTPTENGTFFPVFHFSDNAGNTLQRNSSIIVSNPTSNISVNPAGVNGYDLGTATGGVSYTQTFFASGAASYTWSLKSGTLPLGLTLSAGGVLSGTPNTDGRYTFVLQAANSANMAQVGSHEFTIYITSLSITTTSPLTFANVGTPYSATLTATGALGTVSWAGTNFTLMPPGLTLSSTGVLSGTPTSVGQYSITVQASDSAGSNIAMRTFILNIYAAGSGPPLFLNSSQSDISALGVAFYTLQASGGTPPYHYSLTPGAMAVPGFRVQDGAPLPTNFTISPNGTGGFLGVATTPGVYNTSFRVTDAMGLTFDRATTLTVSSIALLDQATLPKATVGQAYSYTFLNPTGGSGSYVLAASSLPSGFSFNAATRVLSAASPPTAGNFTASITLQDASGGPTFTDNYTVTVNAFAITDSAVLPQATVGVAYTHAFSAPGCVSCVWTSTGLPGGFSLSSVGVLTGTNTSTTGFDTSFTVTATGSNGTVSKIFVIVEPPTSVQELTITTSITTTTTIGGVPATQLSATGGTPPYTFSLLSGTLPAGITLQSPGETLASSLVPGGYYLAGRSQAVGTYNFTIQVTDAASLTATKALTWTISPMNLQYTSLPIAGTTLVAGTAIPGLGQPLLVVGGANSYPSWSVPVSPVYPGLTLNATTGYITGTPTNTGSESQILAVTDSASNFLATNLSINAASGASGPTVTLPFISLGTVVPMGQQFTFNINPSGGTGPYTVTALTALPAGFAILNGSTLTSQFGAGSTELTALPQAPGTYTFTLKATDANGVMGERTYTFVVPDFAFLSSTALGNGSVGVPYSQQIYTFDGAGTVNFSVAVGSALPPGLSLSSGGLLSGTPSQAGAYQFTINLSDASGSIGFSFTLTISDVAVTSLQVLPTVFYGLPYNFTMASTAAAGVTWTAINLPPGLSMSPAGVITGTTTLTPQRFLATITATDGVIPITGLFALYVSYPNPNQPGTNPTPLLDAVVGRIYTQQFNPIGGVGPYTLAVAPGSELPPGINLVPTSSLVNGSPGVSTALFGLPTTAGSFTFSLLTTDAAGIQFTRTYNLHVSTISLVNGNPHNATIGSPYAAQLTAVGGTPPYTFTMAPNVIGQEVLPPGLTMTSAGLISGTPQSTGNYTFYLTAMDSTGVSFTTSLALLSTNASGLYVNNVDWVFYSTGIGGSQILATAGGNSTYTWSVVSGTLPPGLSLSTATSTTLFDGGPAPLGVTFLAGAATAAGNYTYTLRATDTANASNFADHVFTVPVGDEQIVAPANQSAAGLFLPPGQVGSPYSISMSAAGGTPPYTFTESPFLNLPDGMTLSSTGVLSGTPLIAGTFLIRPFVTDATGSQRISFAYSLVVTDNRPAPLIPNVQFIGSDASAGVPYLLPLDRAVTGGTPPYTWSASSLPPGMVAVSGGNGISTYLTGVPTTPGVYPISVVVTDSAGQTLPFNSNTNSITVSPLAFTPEKIPNGVTGTPYSVTLVPTGGTAPYTFTYQNFFFDLPAGLTLTPAGLLSGTPTSAGNFVLAITLTDNVGNTLNRYLDVTIDDPLGEAPAISIAPRPINVTFPVGTPFSGTVNFNSTSGELPFNAIVAGIPGAVLAPSSGMTPGSATLSFTEGEFPVGTYTGLVATNSSASANYGDAVPVNLTVFPLATCNVTLMSSANPSTFGQNVTLSSSLSCPAATGTITFLDGSNVLGTIAVNSASAMLITSTLSVGTHSLSASYSGDSLDMPGNSPFLNQIVNLANTTTALVSSLNPSMLGQSVTLTATVSSNLVTGTVTFNDGANTLATVNVLNGAASFTTSALTVGQHSLTAVYSGDANFASSSSATLTQTVNAVATTTTLTSSANPSTFGQTVTLTATVSPASATGTVTFKQVGITIGTGMLVNGMATFTSSTFATGLNIVTATYGGDASDAASTSAGLPQTVNAAPTTTILTSAPNPSRIGQTVTLTASVSPAAATGTVTFSDGATSIGTATLANGIATLTTSSLALGAHNLSAAYGGDANNAPSVSTAGPGLNFTSAFPGTILDSAGAGTGFTTRLPGTGTNYEGNDPNLTLNTAAGTLTVQSVATDLNGQSNIANGEFIGFPLSSVGVTLNQDFIFSATFRNIQFGLNVDQIGLFAGTSSSNAFRGGVLVAGSPEAFTVATVAGADTNLGPSVALAPSPGDDVIFTISRTSGTWAFTIQNLTTPAKSGAIPLAQPVNLNGVAGLVAGIYASNAGNSTVRTETISSFTFTGGVQNVIPLTTTTTTLMSSLNPSMPGQNVTFTATVAPAGATGTVTFMEGANTLGSGPLNGGAASFTTSALALGMHSITAVYSGDANDATSTSAALTQTVTQAMTTTTLMSSLNPSVFAQNVTFTATVAPASGTGVITFKDGANTLGTVALNAGSAAFSTAGLTAGQHSITASYGGDAGDAASVSAALNQQVNQASTTTTLTSSQNPSQVGQAVTLRATVVPASATGTVTFNDGATPLGSANLSAGAATLSVSPAFGSHPLTAAYAGDQNDASSVSAVLTQSVTFTAITILTTSLPNGSAGAAYGPVSLAASGGSGRFNWSGAGFPNGISVSQGGTVSGTPTAGFNGSVSITATDVTSGLSASSSLTLSISVAPVTISGGPASLGNFIVGAPISAVFTASGGQPPYTWSIAGAPGLSVDSSGKVTGTVGTPGNYTATLTVADSANGSANRMLPLSIFGLTTTGLPPATTTSNYSATLTAAGGTAPYSFTVSGLPNGITFSSPSFSGKPTAPGTSTVSVTANDSGGLTVNGSFTLTVTGPTQLKVFTTSLGDATVGVAYSSALSATGGTSPYAWSQSGGTLPPGMSLDASGNLSGTPTTPGPYSFGAQVSDTSGQIVVGAISINVDPAPLTITTGALPSGVVGFDYPAQTLIGSGGVGPYTFSIRGSLPPGLTLTNSQIAGNPTTAGTSAFTIVATDSEQPAVTGLSGASITIRPPAPDLVLASGNVAFSITSGTTSAPAASSVGITSTVADQNITYSTSASVPWVTISGGSTTPGVVSIALNAAALALTPANSPYSGMVTVSCTAASCSGKSQTIMVGLTVAAPPPQLSLGVNLLSFASLASSPASSTAALPILNTGGGTLKITSVTADSPWITVGAFPATVLPGPGGAVGITVDPTGLAGGYYRGVVTVMSSGGTATAAVTLFISAAATMTLGPSGTQFSMPQAGILGNGSGSFDVSASTGATVPYTAAVQPGAQWLSVNNATGTATGTTSGIVGFSIDPNQAATLATGAYYGTIRVSGGGVVNSPQDFQVVLNVTAATVAVTPDPEPAGLVFVSAGSAALATQTINVYASSRTPIAYQAFATTDAGTWLSISNMQGSSSAGAPGTIMVSASPAGLAPGAYRGSVSVSFGSSVRAVNVTLIIQPAQTTSVTSLDARPAATGPTCSNATLIPTQTGLVSNFSAPASWPTPLSITLFDSCGSSVGSAQITASFSNGDPPLALSLVNANRGVYSGTWTPRKVASQVTITASATAAGYPAASVKIAGQTTPNSAPVLAPNGAGDVFNPQVGAGLGPGNIVQIYGTGLASQQASPVVLPLPTTLSGTSVVIGGVLAPLFYVSPGQVNAQIPFELTAGNQYQLIVNANGALTTPQPLQLNGGTPAILNFTSGEVVAQHLDGTLITDTSPAVPGEFVVIYSSGLGDTDIPVPSGTASPANPPANVLNMPVLTLNGNTVPVLFAGLTPGLVGLYQVNFQVPAGLATGNYDLVLMQSSVVSNKTVLVVQQPQ